VVVRGDRHTTLVLGGYGFFGRRICASLASTAPAGVLVAGRDFARAAAVARSIGLPEQQAVAIDANDPGLARRLGELRVDTVIHAAGPFQHQRYNVARAAIEAGCHYVDLADGRQFVAGIGELDSIARERGVTVVSGASTVPALSSAVVDRHRAQFTRLDAIEIGLSTGGHLPGPATIEGVFGYCGRRFEGWQDGRRVGVYGWQGLRRHRFPRPVGSRWLSNCDVPDLELFPRRYPDVRTVTFQAGFASDPGHLLVWSLASLVRVGALPGLRACAAPLSRVSRWMEPVLSDQGGMFVALTGLAADGSPLRIRWSLLAGSNDGPSIPCGPSIALARKLREGAPLPVGAMPCMGLLTVEEILLPLKDLDVRQVLE